MSPVDPSFSRDNTSAISVAQNFKTAAEMVTQTTPVTAEPFPRINTSSGSNKFILLLVK